MSEKDLSLMGGQILALRVIAALQTSFLMELVDDDKDFIFRFAGAIREVKETLRSQHGLTDDVLEGYQMLSEAFITDIKEIASD